MCSLRLKLLCHVGRRRSQVLLARSAIPLSEEAPVVNVSLMPVEFDDGLGVLQSTNNITTIHLISAKLNVRSVSPRFQSGVRDFQRICFRADRFLKITNVSFHFSNFLFGLKKTQICYVGIELVATSFSCDTVRRCLVLRSFGAILSNNTLREYINQEDDTKAHYGLHEMFIAYCITTSNAVSVTHATTAQCTSFYRCRASFPYPY